MAYPKELKGQVLALVDVRTTDRDDPAKMKAAFKYVQKRVVENLGENIHWKTIMRWWEAAEGPGVQDEVVVQVRQDSREKIADLIQDVVEKTLQAQLAILNAMDVDALKDNPRLMIDYKKSLDVGMGIAVDKLQLMRGEATSIREERGAGNGNIFQQFNQINERKAG